jgi:type I restriction enzyme R subunit
LDEEGFDTSALSTDARAFLEDAISEYNAMFNTAYDTSSDKFENYYKDLSLRLKRREIDLVIVVNMFLTGFDATTLNTLFVDKNLRTHGLMQAFSRTNRILNSVKTYGNIVSFRDLEEATNDAIALFGNKDAKGVVLLKPYAEYLAEYADKASRLLEQFPLNEPIPGEDRQRAFITLFNEILQVLNVLTSFDEFAGNEILTPRQQQDYRSFYLDLYAERKRLQRADKEFINDELVFEIELIKQVEINVDYILMLVREHRDQFGDGSDVEVREKILRGIDASPSLRNKKDLIEQFVDSLSTNRDIDEQWQAFIFTKRNEELNTIIDEENLKPEATRAFVSAAFRDGEVRTAGTAITTVLPPMSLFDPDGGYSERKQRVIDRLLIFFDRFHGLSANTENTFTSVVSQQ